ncbi:MAG: histidine--tRNA ligase [Epulopiscium sp. Nele67-Bin005]|nr:MAG: histidine--tRNA ligase [Epulopiscium sp. Nele67-Bin005]
MAIKALKGTKDIFGDEARKWLLVEEKIHGLCEDFGISQIRTPIFELTNLFQRGVGETTDIVQKEMYSFVDKGENNITLKPESTAAVVRAYLEHSMNTNTQPTKLYYISPTFRYERPETGRFRQFHQFGVEIFGSNSPAADAEVISIGVTLLERLNIKNVDLHINSLGCKECRKVYNAKLTEFLAEKSEYLCNLCDDRREKNPLRVLDCKNANCQSIFEDAPTTLEALGECCNSHFDKLQKLLVSMNIKFIVNPKIVRGLDYYTQTVFEFIPNEGSQGTICGGGRYDGLIEQIGGKPTPAVGFGAGFERLLLVLEEQNGNILEASKRDIFIGYHGEDAMVEAFRLTHNLRKLNICAESDCVQRGVKAQMKYANKINATYATIIGESELEAQILEVKHMETGEENKVKFEDLEQFLKTNIN